MHPAAIRESEKEKSKRRSGANSKKILTLLNNLSPLAQFRIRPHVNIVSFFVFRSQLKVQSEEEKKNSKYAKMK